MFKITLKKKDIFNENNRTHYTSNQVTGRILKECNTCKRVIQPGEQSMTNTRKQIGEKFKRDPKKYVTKHTCIGHCTEVFLNSKFIQ